MGFVEMWTVEETEAAEEEKQRKALVGLEERQRREYRACICVDQGVSQRRSEVRLGFRVFVNEL